MRGRWEGEREGRWGHGVAGGGEARNDLRPLRLLHNRFRRILLRALNVLLRDLVGFVSAGVGGFVR